MTDPVATSATVDAGSAIDAGSRPRWHAQLAVAVTALALLPVVVTIITWVGASYLPGGDIAILDLRVRDVFSADLPLVGPYSRYGWNHPGPAMYYLLAPLNAIAGGAAWSTLVGAAAVEGIAIGLAARLAWRRGGLALVVTIVAAISLAATAVGYRLFVVPWNPHLAFALFALFVLQVWSVGLGERWQLLGATIVGSILVQTHVGYVPLVAGGIAWAVVMVLLDARHDWGSLRPWRAPLAASALAGFLLWLPPLVDQVAGDGNLAKIIGFSDDGGGVGLGDGAGLLAAEFRVLPPWLGGDDLLTPFAGTAEPASLWWLLVPAVLLVAGAIAARRTRPAARLVALLAVLTVVGIVALARVEPPLDTYLFHWRALLATLIAGTTVWTVARAVGVARSRPASLALLAIGVGLVAWSSVTLSSDVADPPSESNPFASDASALVDQLDEHLPTDPFVVRNVGSAYRGLYGAIVDELDRSGAPVRVAPDEEFAFGSHRGASIRDDDEVWFVAEEGRDVSLLTALPGARVLARTTPLGAEDEAELVRIQRQLARELEAGGHADLVSLLEYPEFAPALADVAGIDQDAVRRMTELTRATEGRCRCAVIAIPADVAPRVRVDPRSGT